MSREHHSVDTVLRWLKQTGTDKTRGDMSRYGIPNARAFGVPMGQMQKYAKRLGRNHQLAAELWEHGWYEARTLAVFLDEPEKVTKRQMDRWARDFDSWAICDTACFHLFDKTPHAWDKVSQWTVSSREFVRRAGFAMIWALAAHDKTSANAAFREALVLISNNASDERALVKKAVNMALRSVGKRNRALNKMAISIAKRLAEEKDKTSAWIGRHALRELESEKVQSNL